MKASDKLGLTGIALKKNLQNQEGYMHVQFVPTRGYCVIEKMIGHWALRYGCDKWGCRGHYRFYRYEEVFTALDQWTGIGDPPGPWFEHHAGTSLIINDNIKRPQC